MSAVRQNLAPAEQLENADSLHQLGLELLQRGQAERAVKLLDLVSQIQPKRQDIHAHLGAALGRAGQFLRAANALERAVKSSPRSGEIHANLAIAYKKIGRISKALRHFEQAAKLGFCTADLYENLAYCARRSGLDQRAAEAGLKAADLLDQKGEEPQRAINLRASAALGLFKAGQIEQAWKYFDYRIKAKAQSYAKVLDGPPRYEGQELKGLKLILLAEQGVGDQVMFFALLADLLEQEANLLLYCDERLFPLVARSFPTVALGKLEPELSLPPDYEAYDYIGSFLPRLKPRPADYHARGAYLCSDEVRRDKLRAKYKEVAGERPLIGISWRSANSESGGARSFPLLDWGHHLKELDACFVNLQYGDTGPERALCRDIHGVDLLHDDSIDPMKDLDGFAAQVAALDKVITIDNSTVHIAGALGVPCDLLLPHISDWRWLNQDKTNLWYQSVRLHRADPEKGWLQHLPRLAQDIPRLPAPVSATKKKTALIVNDTSEWYHWGCTGTSWALRRVTASLGYDTLRLPITELRGLSPIPERLEEQKSRRFFETFRKANKRLVEQLSQVDLLVVNGEGSLHGGSENVRALLYLCAVAKRFLNKEVQIINHSAYPELAEWAPLYQDVYSLTSFAAIREPISRDHMKRLGIESVPSFDSLPVFIADYFAAEDIERDNTITLCGSATADEQLIAHYRELINSPSAKPYRFQYLFGANANEAADDKRLADLFLQQLDGQVEIVRASSITQWLREIARSRALIGGRFHYMIAAASLGTPIIALTSNTTKIEGLLSMIGEQPPVAIRDAALDYQLCERLGHLASPLEREAQKERLLNLCHLALNNFAGLA